MVSWLKYQVELFWLALSFFSRIPIPNSTPYSDERMNRSGRYFALVGALLGLLCGVIYLLTARLFPVEIAVFLTMVVSLLLTGAFHEDGLTDMADGIGGGMTVERRLAIMKDSRIGTYGAATLITALLGKFYMLSYLARLDVEMHVSFTYSISTDAFSLPIMLLVFVMAYTVSRTVAASLIFDMPYVSEEKTSKSKPLASRQTLPELFFLIACAIVFLLLLSPIVFISTVGILITLRAMFKRWLIKRVGGFTGDCLGAAQQLSELTIYLILVGFSDNQVALFGGWL
ncbi:adenosylcobinamide-GDP ribazoletransferase [uncultured Vibrio sp.]|uniref:adenosylcobinamide-GDP ribazoletransferase n=1 Tax=uncultured Vibrio sp. TaxID=114054 RepID=UPI000915E1DC|nr:adenosylcobinamide-GDP ribazoletransferase [uncultured Vibrio sp.]OIQ26276.1 MAG: adenosylcobinamide-GDP ribazoletransferase [Vibrio sp. MedPE-SWchi]